MPMTRRSVPRRCLMARSQSRSSCASNMTRRRRTVVVAAAVAAIVTAANASDGAYFSQSWGWVALAFLVPTTVLLILDRVAVPGRLRIAFAAFVGALGVWIALSAVWSISTSASVREVERMLVYVALALAVALVLRRGDGSGVLAGAFVGITVTCGYALATRLFPDRFETFDDPINTYRLAEPLGYWNALGLFSAIGAILAVRTRRPFASDERGNRRRRGRDSRSSLLRSTSRSREVHGRALVVGLGASVALDPRRLSVGLDGARRWGPVGRLRGVRVPARGADDRRRACCRATREGHRVAVGALRRIVVSALVAAWAHAARREPGQPVAHARSSPSTSRSRDRRRRRRRGRRDAVGGPSSDFTSASIARARRRRRRL